MEIWYGPQDRINVEIRPPGGDWIGPIRPGESIRNEALDNGTVLSVYSETYYPANGANRISIVLSPFFGPVRGRRPLRRADRGRRVAGPPDRRRWSGTAATTPGSSGTTPRQRRRCRAGGAWRFPSYFAPGSYTADRMISSLACAERLVAVANVDSPRNTAHVTSSRGPTRDGRSKPDIGADGTDVVAAGGVRPDAAVDRDDGHEHGEPVCLRRRRADARHPPRA